jgi:predicted ATPase
LVLRALRFLEPDIERIAAVGSGAPYATPTRGGFIIKRRGYDQPIPIGSMGDGMWRMLSLAIALIRCKAGILLIDEVDTGLHYTVMADMWRLIAQTSRELGVQVFATTHSFDCVHSLATICRPDVDDGSEVTIQRIEPARSSAVPYTESEISMAAARHIEVR